MKTVLLFAAFICCCGGENEPSPPPPKPDVVKSIPPVAEMFCGDGICDRYRGENEWNCVDCGYDPAIGGPANGGFCGDGMCFGGETMTTCWLDCRPVPVNPNPDPGPFHQR